MYKTIDICTKLCYFVVMNALILNENMDKEKVILRICEYFNMEKPQIFSSTAKEAIKEICVARLCKAIGLTGKCNYKSGFFDFFSDVIGEAVCEILSIKIRIASDEIRLFKYEHINLVEEVKKYFLNESIEEAFLDAFELIDRFKYLVK